MSKTLLYYLRDSERPRFLLLGSTRISAANTGGYTIHSALWIKLGSKLLALNDKSKAASRNKLLEMNFLIIYELSMVPSDLWTDI